MVRPHPEVQVAQCPEDADSRQDLSDSQTDHPRSLMMDPNDFVVLAILAMGGEIQGKTKFQKAVYFLGLLTGCIDDLGYRAHFYGPYSDDVANAIDRLRTIGAVDLT